MRITVLGGAGKMGCIAVQDLVNNPEVEQIIIADVQVNQAEIVAEFLNSPKITIRPVDIQEPDYLIKAIQGSQVCLNATVYYTNLLVMEACLKSGVHYTDMGGLFHTTLKQLKLHDSFAARGLSAVLGMGSAPGIPNIQARYAADHLDSITSIKIYDGIKPPPPDDLRFTYAIPTILDELTMQPMVFRNGQFVACEPMSEFEDYWFTKPIGLLPMHLSLHSEVATLPVTFKDKGIQETFFKINYWGMSKETVEKVGILADLGFNNREAVLIGEQHVVPRQVMIHLLSDYVPPITDFLAPPKNHPPDWVKEIVTEVNGTKDGKQITYRLGTLTCKGALPTGVAPAIAAVWLGKGRIPPGVHPPEAVIEPLTFFKDLERRELYTQITTTAALLQ
jgi:saccharopine dehydrogenase-like NADP-dependent oxidoreductase